MASSSSWCPSSWRSRTHAQIPQCYLDASTKGNSNNNSRPNGNSNNSAHPQGINNNNAASSPTIIHDDDVQNNNSAASDFYKNRDANLSQIKESAPIVDFADIQEFRKQLVEVEKGEILMRY
jgi:hypothetical protein